MKLATENLIFEGLTEGEKADFRKVKTVEQLKETICYYYIHLCRKCISGSFCKFYDPSAPPCPILEKVVHNYIDMNIKSIDTENQYSLSEFIKSVIYLTQVFSYLEKWRGIYVDEVFNLYFEGRHPELNSIYAHDLLVEISKFIRAYRVVKTDRRKKFVVLVEGNSELEALPPIFDALGVRTDSKTDSKSDIKFVNLEGKDRIQKDKIKTNLIKFREEEVSYFLIIDNDNGVKQDIADLKREGLIKDGYYLIWGNKFEDNFGEEAILKVLKEENEDFGEIGIDELKLKGRNSTKKDLGKSIDHLSHEKGLGLKFDDYKVKIARKLSKWVCREIKESMLIGPSRIPTSKSFPDLVEKLRKMAEKIKKISSEFHVIKI